ncbi:MAG TPA: tetratricopeptide repeat protein, partial [Polyangia bacterium]|nr:tetratricopeptide repeat protein [Polyangia bacterium]
HHGARGGFPDQAATCLLALAEAARARHAHAEAEAHFTSALPLLPDPGPARMQALKGRGEARWRLMHFEDALSDFQAARALAANLHDLCAEVELLALESAVCDFCDRRAEAAALIETAHRRAPAELPPRVQARLANWLGVARHRAQRWSEAIELLSQAAALGDALGDHDTKVGSMLLLAYDLGRSGRADEGARLLDQVIAICERTCDVFHLATALTNRVELWRDRKQPARAIADLERAIRLGNQFGLDYVETAGTINLAELQLWQGDLAAAVASAERAHRSACKRFRDRPLPVVSLYYAHLLAHAGRLSEARAVAESAGVGEAELSEPMIALLPPCLRLATGGGSEAEWDALIERARRDAISEQLVEIMWLRGKCALRQHSPAAATRALAAALAEARRLSSALSGPIEADLACAQTMHTRTPTRTLVRAA